jgi:hypothetical protein
MECLKKILGLPGQGTIYLIIDGLDEISNGSGFPTPREQILVIIKKLVDLQLPHVHICITSRAEMDIRDVLEPLATHSVPLHEQAGQKLDIFNYIKAVVHSDRKMLQWRSEDKELVDRDSDEEICQNVSHNCYIDHILTAFSTTKLPLGLLPARIPALLPSAGCPTCFIRIARAFERNIRWNLDGD